MPVRFRFCGDDEVPDWILAGVHGIHAIDIPVLKSLVQTAIDTILHPDFTQVYLVQLYNQTTLWQIEVYNCIENDYKATLPVDLLQYKTVLASILFIVQNALANDITESTLSNELQQIGFPLEQAITLCKIYTENLSKLKSKAKQLSLRCSVPKSVEMIEDGGNNILKLEAWHAESNSKESHSFTVTKEQLDLLIEELTSVYKKIDSLV
ncbi:COMM domain-containing protein 4 isoform X1 [Planococcus citri]|uniref:COMM domain-containing protein 4 isoform X1 n=1 Tax=Planococcus citri TaxID=170843 RepID=UPI0031F788AC